MICWHLSIVLSKLRFSLFLVWWVIFIYNLNISEIMGLCFRRPLLTLASDMRTSTLPLEGSKSPGLPHGPHWHYPTGEGEGCLITARQRWASSFTLGEGSGTSLLLDGDGSLGSPQSLHWHHGNYGEGYQFLLGSEEALVSHSAS